MYVIRKAQTKLVIKYKTNYTQLVLFTIYLQNLHFYLQSKSLRFKNIKLDLQNKLKRI